MDNLPNPVFDVFLSHAHADADLVEKLAARLADKAHFHIWLDKWVLVPGEHWQQEIAKGLDEAHAGYPSFEPHRSPSLAACAP